MKKLFLTSIAALFLTTGAAHAEWEDLKPVANLRYCHITVGIETIRENQATLDLNDLLVLQKSIPQLKKCVKFWDCVADRNKGKVKHCFWPRELGPEPKEDPCLDNKWDDVARGQMSCPPRRPVP
jgi:hypothetical protein